MREAGREYSTRKDRRLSNVRCGILDGLLCRAFCGCFEEAQGAEWREDGESGCVLAEVVDGADAVVGEVVVDAPAEVLADGFFRNIDAPGPFANEVFDVGEAVRAGEVEVCAELSGGLWGEGLGTGSPDGGYPGEAGAGVPLVSEVEPGAGADGLLDLGLMLAGEEGGVADDEGGVGALEHGDRIGGVGQEVGAVHGELAKEKLRIGDRTAGGGVDGDGAEGLEGEWLLDEEDDGADVVERGDGAAGDDGERRGEGGDGDEAEVGLTGEELLSAKRWLGVVDGVTGGEVGVVRRVFEVPHERGGVEEVDGGDAEFG